ncbi:transposase [Elysia marginata]|uniref:Transposase n=1 Tax=Elysia marginata TaxID=1093978 RepID=A0AAV4I7P2_9GAST|nr:transposase [Elysia marginata]
MKMEFTEENTQFYILMRCKLSESAKLIHETLQTACRDCACSYQTVCLWVKEFNEDKESLSDCPRPGRLKSSVNEQIIASTKKNIDEDPHISVRELSDTNGLSYGTVHTIITEHLRMKKVCARWITHSLTVDQKRERVRCATELLNLFEPHGPKRLSNIVTGDETWFPFFIIPPKRLNRMWVDGQGDRPVVLRPGFQS